MGWYVYAAVTTFGKPSFRRRKKFYALYFPAALFYLMYVPLLQLSTFDMDRSETFKWASNICICLGHTGFLYLFWPSNYNSFFPFAFETKEQELARIDARRKMSSRSIFNKVTSDVVSSGEDAKRTTQDQAESFRPLCIKHHPEVTAFQPGRGCLHRFAVSRLVYEAPAMVIQPDG